jgi:hypothetical protein
MALRHDFWSIRGQRTYLKYKRAYMRGSNETHAVPREKKGWEGGMRHTLCPGARGPEREESKDHRHARRDRHNDAGCCACDPCSAEPLTHYIDSPETFKRSSVIAFASIASSDEPAAFGCTEASSPERPTPWPMLA